MKERSELELRSQQFQTPPSSALMMVIRTLILSTTTNHSWSWELGLKEGIGVVVSVE